jgi:diguanylate cyclase (GGDEF)-like protein/PAS domain S-box-containing protein
LQLLGLADSSPEHEFDEIVELATALCGKPLGAMTLLNDTSNYTKSTVGFPPVCVPIEESICRFTVLQDHVMMVEDTHADSRFDGYPPTVRGEGGIRFYAGMPITTVDGSHIGALCVMDTAPSTLTPEQMRSLELLGRQISIRLQLRERAAIAAKMAEEREVETAMFDTILNNVPLEIYLKDAAGRLQFYNRKLAERFKVSPTDWIGKTSYDLWDKETADNIVREDSFVLSSGRSHESFVEVHEPEGVTSYWRSVKVPCRAASGEQLLASCSIDITEQMERERQRQQIQDELEEANRKLNSLALTDSLTGLWNRRAFDARIETMILGSQRNKQPVALLLLDIDDFKSINDRFGHPFGDTVLRQTATLLGRIKRAEDVACRFGGEEFAILLPDTNVEGAQIVAQRILDTFRAFVWDKEAVTASIGIATNHGNGTSDEMVDAADSALYDAKHQGKNRAVTNGSA